MLIVEESIGARISSSNVISLLDNSALSIFASICHSRRCKRTLFIELIDTVSTTFEVSRMIFSRIVSRLMLNNEAKTQLKSSLFNRHSSERKKQIWTNSEMKRNISIRSLRSNDFLSIIRRQDPRECPKEFSSRKLTNLQRLV